VAARGRVGGCRAWTLGTLLVFAQAVRGRPFPLG
jgi:hypothetical protein